MKTPDTLLPTTVEELGRIAGWFSFLSGYVRANKDDELSAELAKIAEKIRDKLK